MCSRSPSLRALWSTRIARWPSRAASPRATVANSLSISLNGSGTATENFWLNYKNGVSYQVVVQTQQNQIDSMDRLSICPSHYPARRKPQYLSNLSTFTRTTSPLSLSHYNVQPVFDVDANVQGTDLGSVSDQVSRIVAKYQGQISKASTIVVRGQVQSMNQSFFQMGLGIGFAILLVYFLMVVNFQSWTDPLIILMALPGALAGILWALFITHTTVSVPALMGCVMSIGVATSNSILMVTFANEQRSPSFGSRDARTAALDCRPHAASPCSHDGAGHADRHAADEPGAGRRRRTKRAAGSRCDRRSCRRDCLHAVLCPRHVQPDAPAGSEES